MNPARSFGTAVMTATTGGSGFAGHWVKTKSFMGNIIFGKKVLVDFANNMYLQVYWIGPILGGITAALVYQMLFRVVPLEDKKEYTEVPLKDVKDNEA